MSKNYYEDLMSRNNGTQHAADYDALDQGPEGTGARHEAVMDVLRDFPVLGRSLLDLGCGTGLLLDGLRRREMLPSRYVGMDFLAEREGHVRRRLRDCDVGGSFVRADLKADEWWRSGRFDVAVAVGVCGSVPFHTGLSVCDLVGQMSMAALHGALTVPSQREGHLGEPGQAHFDIDDLRFMLRNKVGWINLKMIGIKDILLWW